jgi:hypothetical protein
MQVFGSNRTGFCSGSKITQKAVRFERIYNQIRGFRGNGFGSI